MNAVLPFRIKQRREQLKLTQIDLAERTRSSQKQIWLYESGKGMPSIDKLMILAEVLQTTTDWLLGLTEEVEPITSVDELNTSEVKLLNIYRSKSRESQEKIIETAKII